LLVMNTSLTARNEFCPNAILGVIVHGPMRP
jgi:hypothetical protein